MLAQMLTETLLGALTGYVTNNTAIRSLFQPGGVVEKTRDDFAREAGKLLEDQVLTRAVLAQQLQLPEVQRQLAQALEAFMQRELPQALAGQKLADLPDSEISVQFLQQLMAQFARQERPAILSLLKKHLQWDSLLTEAQCAKLCAKLEEILLDTVQQGNLAVQFWQGWQAEKGAVTLQQLGLGALCSAVIENLAQYSAQWPAVLQQQYSAELEQLLLQTMQKLQLRSVLLELDQQMEQYTLQQHLHCNADELNLALGQLLNAERGQAFLADLAEQLLAALSAVEVPAGQILPAGLLEQVTPVLQREMPLLLEQVLDWLQQNKQSVNGMLESAVDEIADEVGGMKGMLLQQLKESVLQQFLQQSDLAALLQQYVLTEQTSQQAAALLMDKVSGILQEKSLGELVQQLNKSNRLQQVLQRLLTENLQRFLEQSGSGLLQTLLDWKPGSLRLAQHQQQVEQWLAHGLLQYVAQVDVSALLREQKEAVQQLTVNQLLNPTEEQLATGVNRMIRQSCRQLAQTLPQVSADTLLQPLYDALEQQLQQRGGQWLRQLANQYTLQEGWQLIQPVLAQQQEPLVQALLTIGLDGIQGRLSKLAEQQIQQLSNEEMLKLVEDFMGQELQPLNYLGAGMGAVAGATVGTALATALPVTAAANPALLLSILAGKSAVFGAVGYGTNCAAVKGLFWPYEPLGGIEMIQGVIPKQKQRFARSMGRMVDTYVINETILQELLRQNRPQWSHLAAQLAADQALLNRGAALVTAQRKAIVETGLRWLKQNGAAQTEQILSRIGGMPLAFLSAGGQSGLTLPYHRLLQQLEGWLNEQLRQEKPLPELLSDEQIWRWLHGWAVKQSVPDLTTMARQLLHSDKPLADFLTAEQQAQLLEGAGKGAEHWLMQPAHQKGLASQLGIVFTPQRVKQWLENSSGSWMEQNLSSLFALAEQALLQLVQSKQEALTKAVQNAILDRLGLMQQMGYTMMGGNEIVANIVDRVLRQKLPIFLSVKGQELQALFTQCWQQQLFPAFLQMPLEQQQVKDTLVTLLEQPVLRQSAGVALRRALELLLAAPIFSWGRLVNVDALLERMQTTLGFQWQMHGAEAVEGWRPFVQKFYAQQLSACTLRSLTRGLQGNLPLAQCVTFAGMDNLLAAFQLRLQENIAITRPEQWLDWSQLAGILQQNAESLLRDERFQQWFCYEGEWIVIQLTTRWEELLPLSLRQAVMEPVVTAVFATAERYGTGLLAAMQLSTLTETQLIAMDNAHLEQVVWGFGSQYLVHIENRGWLGALFALPGMLLYLL